MQIHEITQRKLDEGLLSDLKDKVVQQATQAYEKYATPAGQLASQREKSSRSAEKSADKLVAQFGMPLYKKFAAGAAGKEAVTAGNLSADEEESLTESTVRNALGRVGLYEGLTRGQVRSVKLWESAGQKLAEAELTRDQIAQLFTSVEQGVTAAGSNRTMIGQGKDAVTAVNKAWEDLKTKIQNSGPIKNVDAYYDSAAAKLKQATGGDAGVMQYVQKYRDFAKKHPVAQSFIYAAMIAAAGISGAGLGGAAALGLFKMVDKLLQGEKFSSAAYAGAKTGALAYGASKVADLFKGTQPLPDAAQTGLTQGLNPDQVDYLKNLGKEGSKFVVKDNYLWAKLPDGTLQMLQAPQGVDPNVMLRIAQSGAVKESVRLSESQIRAVFAATTVLNEDFMDTIKGAAGKAADWAKTAGHNLTTKITANKLDQAWKNAGSPTDSDAIAKLLTQQGVSKDVVDSVFKNMNIPTARQTSPNVDAYLDSVREFMIHELSTPNNEVNPDTLENDKIYGKRLDAARDALATAKQSGTDEELKQALINYFGIAKLASMNVAKEKDQDQDAGSTKRFATSDRDIQRTAAAIKKIAGDQRVRKTSNNELNKVLAAADLLAEKKQ